MKGALKAKEAGASCIVVSNHGGRVLDDTPATADVLEEIVQAVGKDMTILLMEEFAAGKIFLSVLH